MESIRHIQQHQVSMMEIVLKLNSLSHAYNTYTHIKKSKVLFFFCLCAPCPDDGFVFIFLSLSCTPLFLLVCFLYLYLSLSFIIYTYIYIHRKKKVNSHISWSIEQKKQVKAKKNGIIKLN